MSPHIPQEICDEVVSHLWGDDDALKACSLACRAFLPPCRQFLFSNIVLFSPTDKKKRPGLTPSLQISLAIRYRTPGGGGDWEGIAQGGLLGALLDIMQLPSLTYLNFQSLPLVMVNHSPNLKHLVIRYLTTNSVMGYSSMHDVSAKSVYLDTLKVQFPDSFLLTNSTSMSPAWFSDIINNTALNVTKLKKLHANAAGDFRAHHDMWMLLKLCAGSLEELAFTPAIDVSEPESSSMDPIDWSILTNLKRFCIHVEVSYDYLDHDDEIISDAFPWFVSMLRKQSLSGSSIEEYVVQVNYDVRGSDIHLSCWKEVIGLFSSRNRFPRLRKLHIRIHYFNRDKEGIAAELEQFVVELKTARQEVDCQVSLAGASYKDFFIFPPDPTWIASSWLDF
ncbi:hypothetical protein BDZ97DRAFT_2072297 [Flammula alnicola]|nr:hypothetical protein BDZ97DRAFT_2072297 [Flammula alnicola]